LADYRVSERRACAMVMLSRTVFCYIDHKRDDRAVRQRIREIAETRVRYGFERIQSCYGGKGGETITSGLTAFTARKA
jgi:putative transposase